VEARSTKPTNPCQVLDSKSYHDAIKKLSLPAVDPTKCRTHLNYLTIMNNLNEDSPKFPPARPEITAEIVALDCLLADLILKCQGNARELDNLVRVIDNHLAACEMERDNLLGIESERPLTMTDLPIVEQKMIVGAGLLSSYLLEAVAIMTQTDPELLGEKISEKVNETITNFPPDEITNTLNRYLIKHAEALENTKKNT